MLLKLDHSAATDVPLGISKLLKLLQREVLDVSMIDLMWNDVELLTTEYWRGLDNHVKMSWQLAVSHFQRNIYHLLSTKAW